MRIKEFQTSKKGKKIKWELDRFYRLGDEGVDLPFRLTILNKDEIVKEMVIIVPSAILETWNNDQIITNFLISQVGIELDLDNTIDLVLAKLNSGTITYASGTQEENDNILKNYATFVALNIESYKDGDIELSDIPKIQNYNVKVTSNSVEFDYMEFIANLVPKSESEKTSLLNSCIASIEAELNIESTIQPGTVGSPKI